MDNPYGVTIFTGSGATPRSTSYWTQFLGDVQGLGLSWVRTQRRWRDIENPRGTYNWAGLDDDVARLNAAGINVAFPLQDAPSWALQNPAQTVDGTHYLPDPSMMAGFAQAVATRYNGSNGHGFINSIEVGNEDFDVIYDASYPISNQPYRDVRFFTPCLAACSPVIRAASPTALIGMCGLWWREFPHVQNFMQGIYSAGLKSSFDYCNFHFYNADHDPLTSQNGGAYPSFPAEWAAIQGVMATNGDGAKPVWVTEFGWATTSVNQPYVVTQAQQSQYYQALLDSARLSGVVKKCFFYTLSYSGDGDSLVQGAIDNVTYVPTYSALKNYITQYPEW